MSYYYCFVSECKNTSKLTPTKKFYSVPRSAERLTWFRAVGKEPGSLQSRLHCCGDHFKESDIERSVKDGVVVTKLKSNAVPQIRVDANIQVKLMLEVGTQTETIQTNETIETDGTAKTNEAFRTDESVKTDETIKTAERPNEISVEIDKPPIIKLDSSTWDTWGEATYVIPKGLFKSAKRPRREYKEDPFWDNSGPSSDSQPSDTQNQSSQSSKASYSQEYAEKEEKNLLREVNVTLMEKNPRYFFGLNEDTFNIIQLLEKHTKCSKINIYICLRKIRLNEASEGIALVLGFSKGYVGEIIKDTIPKLTSFLKTFIFWPEKKIIQANLPLAFRANFSCVQSITDCFEVEIERPSDSLHQALTYSHYKKCNTLKFLVSSTPDGFINFISKGFGGRTSDKEIVKSSGYLDHLPPNASILADRGFKEIGEMLHQHQCDLYKPESVSAGQKLSQKEVVDTRVIAGLRIHIERIIRHIRDFAFFSPHSCFHHELTSLVDSIGIITCALCNLQPPIVH